MDLSFTALTLCLTFFLCANRFEVYPYVTLPRGLLPFSLRFGTFCNPLSRIFALLCSTGLGASFGGSGFAEQPLLLTVFLPFSSSDVSFREFCSPFSLPVEVRISDDVIRTYFDVIQVHKWSRDRLRLLLFPECVLLWCCIHRVQSVRAFTMHFLCSNNKQFF